MAPLYCQQLGVLLQKNTLTLVRHYVLFIIMLIMPIFCVWTLSWSKPIIDPEDLSPETYQSSQLEYPECASKTGDDDHCFLLAYYPYSESLSDGEEFGLTERVAEFIAGKYDNIKTCHYKPENPVVPDQTDSDNGGQNLSDDYSYNDCQIIGFTDRDQFNEWMKDTAHQGDRVKGAFSVDETAWYAQLVGYEVATDPIQNLQLGYTVYYNNTYDQQTPSNIKIPLAIGNMVHEGLTKALLTDFLAENNYCGNITDVNYKLEWSFFPQLKTYESIIDTIGTGAPIILSLSIAINYAIFSFFIISEKQGKLRQTLYIVGVSDSVFWFSHIIVQLVLAVIFGTLCTISVYMFGFYQGKYTDYWTLGATFTLYYVAANSFILLMCAVLWNVKVAVFFTILIFVAMLIGEMIQVQGIEDYFPGHPSDDVPSYETNEVGRTLLQIFWFPTNFAAALAQLGDFTVPKIDDLTSLPTTPPGFSFGDAFKVMSGGDTNPKIGTWDIPMYQQWGFLVLNAVIYCLLGAYLDNVMPFAHGARGSPIFCFHPSYWGLVKQVMPPTASQHYDYKPEEQRNDENRVYSVDELKENPYHELPEWDEDVRNEARKLWTPYSERDMEEVGAIEMINLCKTFPRRPPSVLNMNLSIAKNQVFTLLGPNGAGKTTTISMLTGSLMPTSGYASILGHSITHERTRISPHIGLTPQHDILWPEMSCEEHLVFFAKLRGIDPVKELDRLIEEEEAAIKSGIASSSNLAKLKSISRMNKRGSGGSRSGTGNSRTSSTAHTDTESSRSSRSMSHHSSHTGTASNSSFTKSTRSSSSRRIYRPGFSYGGQTNFQKQTPMQQLALMRLQDVNLRSSAKLLVSALSGGMRRRLTLSISLLGGPDVVFLDEPTTGLDPVSRRLVWDVITRAKRGHSIVLTTHSMEEADTLSDRIGIMARGILRCLGSSAHLKRLYGLGYRLDLETLYDAERCVSNVLRVRNELVMPIIPEARLISKTGGHLTLALPRTVSSKQLEDFLVAVETVCENEPELVRDWSLRQTTLEEVFLAIVRVAEKQHEMRTRRTQMVGDLVKNSN